MSDSQLPSGSPADGPAAAEPVGQRPPPLPAAGKDLNDARVVADIFDAAAEANLATPGRKGACVHLPPVGSVVLTGDLHDNGNNFFKVLHLANLHQDPKRHLVLQELIHGENLVNGCDMSVRTLARAAALKLDYPDRVHLVLSNHELSQMLGGAGIMKDGISSTDVFEEGLHFVYGDKVTLVRDAMNRFVRSYPLAVRTQGGVFCSHSLPGQRAMETFDVGVIDRDLTDADINPGGSAYTMVWGRNQGQDIADQLAEAWGVKVFVCGHQPAEMGSEIMNRRMLIINSDHEHGCGLPVYLGQSYELDDLIDLVRPLASVMV